MINKVIQNEIKEHLPTHLKVSNRIIYEIFVLNLSNVFDEMMIGENKIHPQHQSH
jgi:hypothetical protein